MTVLEVADFVKCGREADRCLAVIEVCSAGDDSELYDLDTFEERAFEGFAESLMVLNFLYSIKEWRPGLGNEVSCTDSLGYTT